MPTAVTAARPLSEATRADRAADAVRMLAGRAGRFVRPAEYAFGVFALVALTLGPLYQVRFRWGGPLAVDFVDDSFVQAVFYAVYAVAGMILVRTWRGLQGRGGAVVWCSLLSLALIVSTLWSTDRVRTLGQAVLFAGTTLFGFYLAQRFTLIEQVALLWGALQIGVAWSAWALWRDWPGSRDLEGHWTGIYFTRNSLGPVCALSLCAVLVLAARLAARRTPATWLAVVALGVWSLVAARLLVGTRSLTPTLGAACLLATGASWLVLGRAVGRGRLRAVTARWGFVAAVAVAATVVVIGRAAALKAVGKSPTLETRTVIWAQVWEGIRLHPVRGHGWLAAWTDQDFLDGLAQRYAIREQIPPKVGSAHNGYLEMLLGIGFAGGVILLGTLVTLARRSVRWVGGHGAVAVWPVAVTAYALAVNTQESFLGANLLVWVLLVAAGAGVLPAADATTPSALRRGRPGRDAAAG